MLTNEQITRILEISEPILLFVDRKPERTDQELAEYLVIQSKAGIMMNASGKNSELALKVLEVAGEVVSHYCARCSSIAAECEDMLGEEIAEELIDAYCLRHNHMRKLELRPEEEE